jgi:hypothetical protein
MNVKGYARQDYVTGAFKSSEFMPRFRQYSQQKRRNWKLQRGVLSISGVEN